MTPNNLSSATSLLVTLYPMNRTFQAWAILLFPSLAAESIVLSSMTAIVTSHAACHPTMPGHYHLPHPTPGSDVTGRPDLCPEISSSL
ncbi:hypothetical protein GDO81_021695 [Engystomops pustulosus]|uniref:NADH dehydrogenase subunit 4L n=1 Tax=Engystomops pustulosus TaxID=76066 RepID=A0AAV6YQN2_ENGPU|nr:hypothetical protein GDO81_021695 [Engystomops pustulosus]